MTIPAPAKILVVRLSSLGDVVLTTALFPNLKAHWPESEITVLTRAVFAPVFERNPHIGHVRVYAPEKQSFSQLVNEIRSEKFDVVIDLHGNPRSWFLRLLAGAPTTVVVEKATWARYKLVLFKKTSPVLDRSVRERILDCLAPLDVPVVKTDTELYPPPPAPVLESLGLPTGRRLIGIAPGARHNTKRWPAARFAEAAARLAALPDSLVVLLGDKNDRGVAEEVASRLSVPSKNLAGWTSLRELIAVTSQLSLLLTNDSALLHIGEACRVPVVALFGPTVRPFGFAPYRATSRVAEVGNLGCRPCTLHGGERCPLKHHRCMEDLDVNAVLFVASELVAAGSESA